mgnify:CR=1 FL=1
MTVKESYSEDKMLVTAHAIAKILAQNQQDIEATKDGIYSELGKVLAYLRNAINYNKSEAGTNFFKYLKALVDSSQSSKRSDKTPHYYRSINNACNQHLMDLQSNPDKILEILGWTFRLFKYYKVTPVEDFEELSVLNSQLEIQTAAQSQDLKENDEIEATITNKSGNKVTYKMFNTLTKTIKEPKKHQLLQKGDEVIVNITEIENGVPKKVKYVRHKS